jgi:hypothetical protein
LLRTKLKASQTQNEKLSDELDNAKEKCGHTFVFTYIIREAALANKIEDLEEEIQKLKKVRSLLRPLIEH